MLVVTGLALLVGLVVLARLARHSNLTAASGTNTEPMDKAWGDADGFKPAGQTGRPREQRTGTSLLRLLAFQPWAVRWR